MDSKELYQLKSIAFNLLNNWLMNYKHCCSQEPVISSCFLSDVCVTVSCHCESHLWRREQHVQ